MKYFFFFLAVSLFSFSVQAQKGYYEGFVILTSGDTLEGMIKHKSGEEIKEKISLKVSDEEKYTYKPSDLLRFNAGGDVFVSGQVEGEEGPVFLKLLEEGPINLYEYQYSMDQSGSLIAKYEVYIVIEGKPEMINIKPGNFKKLIAGYVSDYPSLATGVEKNKYKIDDIQKVVHEYNAFKLGLE